MLTYILIGWLNTGYSGVFVTQEFNSLANCETVKEHMLSQEEYILNSRNSFLECFEK
jgi:hypothetical protein